ncbi:MAG: aminopeptidase P family N-terminal domain-containing protein [Devosia sp.]|nr:aminopeptidase P family N-terminal domain-containing protein [Devosia sp.]
MPSYRLIDAGLPAFGVPIVRPELYDAIYTQRLAALIRARRAAGLDALVVYADREHAANLAYITGFDPRFEEALLVMVPDNPPTLLAGPENLARAGNAAIEVEARLYPPFGLLGQDRSKTPALEEVLRNAGIGPKHRVGVLGWKYFGLRRPPSRKPGSRRPPISSTRCAASPGRTGGWSTPMPS